MSSLLEDLRKRRTEVRAAGDALLATATAEERDLTPDEASAYQTRVAEARDVDDRIEEQLAEQVRELRAAETHRPGPAPARGPILTRDQSLTDWCQTRGMVTPEGPQPSFDNYLRGLATGQWDGAEQERALSVGTTTAGGHLVPAPLSARVLDLARNNMVVMKAGATTVPMTSSTLKMARLTDEGTPAWHTENAAVTDADMVFDSVTFTARTLTRLVKLSVELFEDADPSSGDVIANAFASQLALELDRVALRGTGTAPEPRGVLNQSGITSTSHGAAGTVISNYDWWLDAVGAVRAANFEPNAQIQAPRSATSLSKLKEAVSLSYMTPPAGLANIPRLNTKSVPINLTLTTSTDCSEIYTGQWDQLMIGMRTDFKLQFLQERFLADNLQYAFLATLRCDVQLAHPAAFAVDLGIRA